MEDIYMNDICKKYGIPTGAAVLAAMLFVPLAHAATTTTASSARIPFADLGGIADWKADGDRGLYIQARDKTWYHASFMGPCMGVQFRERVGFVTEPGGELDKFSSVLAGDQRCYFKTFERSDPPGS